MKTILFTIALVSLSSCVISKEQRRTKRVTKELRESFYLLHANNRKFFNPAGYSFHLRNNDSFELRKGFCSIGSFETGTWVFGQSDTLTLNFMDSKKLISRTEHIIINRENSTLVFSENSVHDRFELKITYDNTLGTDPKIR